MSPSPAPPCPPSFRPPLCPLPSAPGQPIPLTADLFVPCPAQAPCPPCPGSKCSPPEMPSAPAAVTMVTKTRGPSHCRRLLSRAVLWPIPVSAPARSLQQPLCLLLITYRLSQSLRGGRTPLPNLEARLSGAPSPRRPCTSGLHLLQPPGQDQGPPAPAPVRQAQLMARPAPSCEPRVPPPVSRTPPSHSSSGPLPPPPSLSQTLLLQGSSSQSPQQHLT